MSDLTTIVRREVQRAASGARQAFRALRSGLQRGLPVQLVDGDGLAAEQLKALELFQQFGFTSAPPAGTQLIVVPLGGRTSAAVVVATEHGVYRFQLGADGEAAVYNQWGDLVHLRQDRTIHVVAQAKVLIETETLEINATTSVHINTPELIVDASTVVELNTPTVDASDDIVAGGDVSDAGGSKSMSGMRATFDAHVHPENDSGGPTAAPTTPM